MFAHTDDLPKRLSPVDEIVILNHAYAITMCDKTPDSQGFADYDTFYKLVQRIDNQLTACDYASQDRATGALMVRPSFLTLYHERVRPLAESEINTLWMLGRSYQLTISLTLQLLREKSLLKA